MVMGFWGLHVRPDKTYTQVVDATFHLTMAALGDDAEDGKRSCLKVTVDKKDFILCSLTLGKMEQQPLNVAFVENEEVTFSVSGKNSVHLTGNYLDNDDDDDMDPYGDQGLMELQYDESDEDEEADTNNLEIKTKGAQRLYADDESDSEDEDWEAESDDNDEDEDQDEEQHDKTPVKDTKKRPSSGSVPSTQEQSSKKQKTAAEPNGKAAVQKKGEQQQQQKQQQQKEKKKELPAKKEEKKTETSSKKGEKQTEFPAKNDDEKLETLAKKDNKKAESNSEEKPKKTTLPNGLVIEDVKIGTGPKAKSGKKIGMRYIGRLSSGKIFDSNLKGKPFYFNLGKGEVIKGWDIGITGMQLGGERKLTIPAPLAYGSQGAPPDIPKNATLEFEVKLINIK